MNYINYIPTQQAHKRLSKPSMKYPVIWLHAL